MQKADSVVFETLIERVGAGERLSGDEVRALATTPDILSLGMLADVWRRHRHGSRATYLRVADCPVDSPLTPSALGKAREVRITGSPARLADALRAVEAVKALGDLTVSAFTWSDIDRMAAGENVATVLSQLRGAGLDSLAELPLDEGATDVAIVIDRLSSAGLTGIRLSIDKAPAEARTNLLLRAAELQDRFGCIQALNPLPMTLAAFRPTTGYDDVKMVAIGRLAAPNIPTIQVDWRRYGPKLAQVALTFGADDIDGISASDEAPEGRRRAPLEEIPRNIEAAGFEAIERSGRFTVPCLMALRIGAVGYLNARPLTWALDRAPDRWHVRYDLPSVCARLLQDGEIDLGLVPSIEYLQAADYRFVPGVGVTSRGPIASVALYTKRPIDRDSPHRAGHELADLSGADSGAVPAPLSDSSPVRAARPRPGGHDTRFRCGCADRGSGIRSGSRRARSAESRSRA